MVKDVLGGFGFAMYNFCLVFMVVEIVMERRLCGLKNCTQKLHASLYDWYIRILDILEVHT